MLLFVVCFVTVLHNFFLAANVLVLFIISDFHKHFIYLFIIILGGIIFYLSASNGVCFQCFLLLFFQYLLSIYINEFAMIGKSNK